MPLSLRRAFFVALICLTTLPAIPLTDVRAQTRKPSRGGAIKPPAVAVPAPKEVIGFTPGDDRKLASWSQIVDYFKRLQQSDRRLILNDLGKTTLGRPFVVAMISSPANLANISRLQEIQRKLADPRLIGSRDAEAEKLIAEGRTVVLITCGIHSTEVGGPLAAMNIAYKLLSDDSPQTREILDNCIVLLVPSLNPDGVDIVKNWYDKTLGTAAEGTSPPELYHHYTGHDNNRDWYAFTQVETQMVVSGIQNIWRPQIVHDIHQQGETGSRFFIPPYVEPWEPNVPPLIQAGVNFMGSAMAWEMASEGKAGVVINGVYDAWTPARAYQHYHGGIRILSETASCRIATPTRVPFERLTPQIGVDPKVRSWNFPNVWPGGEWRLANIVDYMQSGAFALMRNAARYRERWLRDFYRIGKDAVGERKAGEPFAFLIPPVDSYDFWKFEGRGRLLVALKRGDVEMVEVDEPFEAEGKKYPAGTTIILMRQPYGAFAKTLLERQHYPDLREYPGGPPRRPYDVTAHTLPLLMGVNVVQVNHPFRVPARSGTSGGIGAQRGVNEAAPRVGLYKSYVAAMDEGWTRWIFDQLKPRIDWFSFGYQSLLDEEVRAGNLRAKYDCIILPAQGAASIVNGLAKDRYPAEVAGGITTAGVEALKQFIEDGGTLITLNEASQFAIDYLNAPVRNVLAGVAAKDFYCPGSILKIKLDTSDPLTKNAPLLGSSNDESIAWFESSPAFETTGGDARVIARFADAKEVLLSGWLLGAEKIAGKGAIVEVKRGKGRIVMFGFRPQYRGQSIATLPFLFNAIETSVPASMRPRVVSVR
jgi:hypothetical protein